MDNKNTYSNNSDSSSSVMFDKDVDEKVEYGDQQESMLNNFSKQKNHDMNKTNQERGHQQRSKNKRNN